MTFAARLAQHADVLAEGALQGKDSYVGLTLGGQTAPVEPAAADGGVLPATLPAAVLDELLRLYLTYLQAGHGFAQPL